MAQGFTGTNVPDGSMVPSKMASGFFAAGRNKIINGNFNVWQRGTAFNGLTSLTKTADRWIWSKNTTAATVNVTASTDVPSAVGANYSLLITQTATTDSSVDAGDRMILYQGIEGYNVLPFKTGPFTLSFWVKTNRPTSGSERYCVGMANAGPDAHYIAEYQVTTTGWEKKTITVPALATGIGTWNFGTGGGIYLMFNLMAGSTYQAAPNVWASGNTCATSNQVNFCATAGNTFQLSQVQLELGSTAEDFEYLLYPHELALCQRYYWRIWPGTAAYGYVGQCYSTTNAEILIPLPTMRTNPTGGLSAYSDFVLWQAGSGGSSLTSSSYSSNYSTFLRLRAIVGASLAAGDCTTLQFNNANAWLDADAEIT